MRAAVITEDDLPHEALDALGPTGSARIGALVEDLVEHSARAGDVVQGPTAGDAMATLRAFMFERVYLAPAARAEHAKIRGVVATLFDHFRDHPEQLPGTADDLAQRVTDYLAGMTDRFCLRAFTELTVPDTFAP